MRRFWRIAVDPSGCAGEEDKRSDEIGIVAAGIGHDGIGRVLEDATGRYSPDGWANKTLQLFDRWKADRIVAERNLGCLADAAFRDKVEKALRYYALKTQGREARSGPYATCHIFGPFFKSKFLFHSLPRCLSGGRRGAADFAGGALVFSAAAQRLTGRYRSPNRTAMEPSSLFSTRTLALRNPLCRKNESGA